MARNITQLHPRLQQKVAELKALCEKEGLALGIGECFRTVAEQDALYAQGRTTAGSIVTNAKGSTYSSQHQWGIAFDFFKNVKGHAYDDAAFFSKVGTLAKSIGLAWGGDWTGFVDKPHLYLPDWGSTTTKLKQQYGTFENFKKTWTQSCETPKQEATQPSTYTGNSIVDYLNSIGKASDFASRKKYATQYGISNYKGTAEQNLKLLALMRGGTSTPTPKPQASIYYPKYTGSSYGIDTVLAVIGVPASMRGNWKNRKGIANANGVLNYTGSGEQNLYLIGLAKQGKLKKV